MLPRPSAKPKMIFAEQGPYYSRALAAIAGEGVEIVTAMPISDRETIAYDDLVKTQPSSDVRASMDAIDHETVAKYLFTSGSTGMPKGVI